MGTQLPSLKRGQSPIPNLGPSLLWPNGRMDQDVTLYGGRPHPRPHCTGWGPSPPKGGSHPPAQFRPMSHVAKRLDGLRCHLVWRWASANIVLWDTAPLPNGHSPQFLAHICCGQMARWIKIQDVTWYGGRPRPKGHSVRWVPSSPPKKRDKAPSPIFGPCMQVGLSQATLC